MSNYYIDPYNNFLCHNITPEEIRDAEQFYKSHFGNNTSLNGRTMTDGMTHRLGGVLGEILFKKLMGDRVIYVGDRNKSPFDFLFPVENGKDRKIDVKCSTRNVSPRPFHEAIINNYQTSDNFSQVTDYVFMCINRSFEKVWFCGYISKNKFFKLANFNEKGSIAGNNIPYKGDCWTLLYRYLNQYRI